MQTDNQHLDFLISQYVDGCLEGPNKKSVEQKMLTDPEARKLYVEHREVQDLLDDWGNRIPLINWDEFDQKLAGQLEADAKVAERVSIFRRRLRPLAVAAALLLAVGLGYGWHAMSQEKPLVTTMGGGTVAVAAPARTGVVYPDMQTPNHPSQSGLTVVEAAGQGHGKAETVVISAPAEATALQALRVNVEYGIGHLAEGVVPQTAPAANSVMVVVPTTQKDDKEIGPGLR